MASFFEMEVDKAFQNTTKWFSPNEIIERITDQREEMDQKWRMEVGSKPRPAWMQRFWRFWHTPTSGTLYPVLICFEKEGILESKWENKTPPPDPSAPRRRLYRYTKDGIFKSAHYLHGIETPHWLKEEDP